MKAPATETIYCAQCGTPIPADAPRIEHFGERFCSADHADVFVGAVRAARVAHVARESSLPACHLAAAAQGSWMDRLKRSACWAAPLLIVVAIPLLWSGNALAATGGSVLSLLAVLACPIAMFFMMRAMMPAHDHDTRGNASTEPPPAAKGDRRA